MRVAVSNIAWSAGRRDEAADLLVDLGVRGVEIAPTKYWDDPPSASRAEVTAVRDYWRDRGIEIVAMQSLLYGRDELRVFGSPDVRRRTLDYLLGMIELAGALGAGPLVFGSPRQRKAGDLPGEEREEIAGRFFAELGRAASREGVCLCIEPNPPEYGTDFVTSVEAARALVDRVDSPGFGLHLDAGGMTLAGEDPRGAVADARGVLRHVHVSEPYLAPVGAGGEARNGRHRDFAAALRASGYDGWCSIEMRPAEDGDELGAVRGAVEFTKRAYGGS